MSGIVLRAKKFGLLKFGLGELSGQIRSYEKAFQSLDFPAEVIRTFEDERTLLATGEELESLIGYVRLIRGSEYADDRFPLGAFYYSVAFEGEYDIEPSPASFGVALYLNESAFDQVAELGRQSGLPDISIDFGIDGPFQCRSPHSWFWDNKEYPTANILGVNFIAPLTNAFGSHEANRKRQNGMAFSQDLVSYLLYSEGQRDALSKYLDLPDRCNTRRILDELTQQVWKSCEQTEVRRKIWNMVCFVAEMQEALNPLAPNRPPELRSTLLLSEYRYREELFREPHQGANPYLYIWFHRNPYLGVFGDDIGKRGHYWPLDRERLTDICRDYIAQEWLHCAMIDKILIDAAIYNETLKLGEELKPLLAKAGYLEGRLFNFRETHVDDLKIKIFMESLRRGILALAAIFLGLGVVYLYGWWVGCFVGFVFWFSLIISSSCLKNTEKLKAIDRNGELLFEMQRISELMQDENIYPGYLKERLTITASEGAQWPVAIFAILDLAIARGPSGEWR
jgi:hypothetical protein